MSDEKIYREILRIREQGGQAALATIVRTRGSTPGALGAKMLVLQSGSIIGSVGGGCVEAEVASLAKQVIREDRPRSCSYKLNGDMGYDSGLICGGELEIFIEPVAQPVLYILGGGHIGLALGKLAEMIGFQLVVIDDRSFFANKERFPDALETIVGDFEQLLPGIRARTGAYLAIATRGHKHDGLALEWALQQKARYVGLLGSKVKIAKLKNRLKRKGVPAEELDQIYAPIGLDIGSVSIEEIAVSIAAELVSIRRTGRGRPRRIDLAAASDAAEQEVEVVEPGARHG